MYRHLLASVTALAAAIAATLPALAAPAACLPGGDDATLNAAFAEPGAIVELCPGAVFTLNHTVVMPKDGQQLRTALKPSKGWKPATLRVAGAEQAVAIRSRASGIRLQRLVVDGRRRDLGRVPKGGALIELGGSGVRDVQVSQVRALDPRGWSVIHAFEGDKTCTDVVIENNHFGPAGAPNGEWADGISLACRNSTVRRNLIEDATDGAIVIFGAPGSLVEDNHIVTRRNVLLGGINLVDYKPYDGDYTGTRVRRNRISAEGGFIKIGIAIGPSVWGADNKNYIRGASVTDNVIGGKHLGYGIAADGARDVDISRNQVLSDFNGRIGPQCYKELKLPRARQVANPERTSGRREVSMAEAEVRYAICIEPTP